MNIVLLGSPGSGKGTQAEVLSRRLGIPAVSTGNILREAMRQGTEVGLAAKSYIDAGQLVPDEVMVGIVRERLAAPDCARGFILDGFPRTIAQAVALDGIGVTVQAVLSLEVPDEDIERRMAGRRSCRLCGNTYHVQVNPPAVEGVCDSCGGELYQRDDDVPAVVRARLITYHENTEPLKGHYESRGLLRVVAARDAIEKVTEHCLEVLEALS
ncbi:MAG: adenylate kinase [Oscillospiraceae bacterium]|jgi:adenylate kinase|nr:adenylate kinase [Oscillospiraceae bacterium]